MRLCMRFVKLSDFSFQMSICKIAILFFFFTSQDEVNGKDVGVGR
jgi:hypothetical protein